MARLYAGTSGFSYPEWKGKFYPAGLQASEMLRFYSRALATVEINNSFYRYPTEETLRQWMQTVPEDFVFSMKAHRRVTHLKRLADIDQDLGFLAERFSALGARLGLVLFQLPPTLRCDLSVFETFLTQIRPAGRAVVEFRHATWRQDAVYELMNTHHVSLVIGETDEEAQPKDIVGPISYLRLHKSNYTPEEITQWAGWICDRLGEGRDVFAYFTHDGTPGYEYARTLADAVTASPRS
ncbi:MAG TPA: DUF72 domain-containing protein [bacterium]|nr:DUF72 domain-containing protein [bacterium]